MNDQKQEHTLIYTLIGVGYVLAIAGCFTAAIWAKDLRWLGTGLILVLVLVAIAKMGGGDE